MSKESIDPKAALRVLPPLIKGYLRLGGFIGDGAVVDREFGTTDVLIVLPVQRHQDALHRSTSISSRPRGVTLYSLRSDTSRPGWLLPFFQDEVGALAGRQDVFVQIDEIDPRPDRRRGRRSPPRRRAANSDENRIADRGTRFRAASESARHTSA